MKTTLTCDETRQVDRRAVEEYGMSSLVLMENAGRGVVDKLCALGIQGPVVVCCGKGNNAGDGFVASRHLDIRGVSVKVLLCGDPNDLSGDAEANFRIIEKAGLPIEVFGKAIDKAALDRRFQGANWVVDALLGTGAKGAPRPPFDLVIQRLNASAAHKLAIDVPSGLDCDTGEPSTPIFRAEHTCTFVAEKPGFLKRNARQFTGELHVLDIGVPRKLITEIMHRADS